MVLNRAFHFCGCVVVAILAPCQLGGTPHAPENECLVTAKMTTYSNAEYIEEAGDVVGYELALRHGKDTSIDARLFVYEGVPNEDGISISGHVADGKVDGR